MTNHRQKRHQLNTGKSSKKPRKMPGSDASFDFDHGSSEDEMLSVGDEENDYGNDDTENEEGGDSEEGDDEEEGHEEDAEGDNRDHESKDAEMEELEKEYVNLHHEEQDILENLKRHKDADFLKGQAVKNQKALWDKILEFRFLLQKAFSGSNRLPQEPVRSSFCDSVTGVHEAFSDLIISSKKTLDSIYELQEALLEKNPSITQAPDAITSRFEGNLAPKSNQAGDDEWLQISQMHARQAYFRDKSIDKWQRKTQVTSGAAAVKGRLHAFNQNISEQVASYMRDPSRMIRGMQQRKSVIHIFGDDWDSIGKNEGKVTDADGDPELLNDSEFYHQLLKEFLETANPASSETAFYALRRLQPKKRKNVDRHASKSRKVRYNVHEKLVNFMAPRPMVLPDMAPKLFENLFGLKTQKSTSVA